MPNKRKEAGSGVAMAPPPSGDCQVLRGPWEVKFREVGVVVSVRGLAEELNKELKLPVCICEEVPGVWLKVVVRSPVGTVYR